jgi:hypothetical protein
MDEVQKPSGSEWCTPSPEPFTQVNHFVLRLAFYYYIIINNGARDSVVDKALCYKMEGRGFDTR